MLQILLNVGNFLLFFTVSVLASNIKLVNKKFVVCVFLADSGRI